MTQKIVGFAVYGAIFLVGWILLWVWRNYGFQAIDGAEMIPTVKPDSHSFFTAFHGTADELKVNDIVRYELHRADYLKQEFWLGRIVAKPGDRVKIIKGEVIINGAPVRMDYVQTRSSETLPEILVPRDTVYILHDNRRNLMNPVIHSFGFSDSREFGPLGIHAIIGKY